MRILAPDLYWEPDAAPFKTQICSRECCNDGDGKDKRSLPLQGSATQKPGASDLIGRPQNDYKWRVQRWCPCS